MQTTLSTEITLPDNYHTHDFFALHQRDKQNIAEIVEQNKIQKGMMWDDKPAELTIAINAKTAHIQLKIDGDTTGPDERLSTLASHMLGLLQPVHLFECLYKEHPVIGSLIARQSGLKIYQSATPFEALSWAVIGQQISVSAAISIRRRFIQAMGVQHSSGLWCFPTARQIVNHSEDELRQCGFSVSKAKALLRLSQLIESGELTLAISNSETDIQQLIDNLLAIKGIGMWTINYSLLRGFNYLNGSLHGDVAVRRNIQRLFNQNEKVSAEQAEKWLADFAPWKALLAAHLWQQESSAGY
ncbi:3-methyladenine DNA glycosylase 2 [Photorhabdus sp. HUG-39]|uniref:DNA-3-methyladenine glycosylase II n=2 Tax=Morganellaceae TaxID=1903414 RepID=A0ABX0B0Y3_9GAMM|nr:MULTISPECIES: DNA-3-methyladenine glycosylase [Photorhabdus]MCC8373963.1 DNA-3-methyladenine glycosylase 2 [Photorhabdus bodei]MCT8351735.1 DNA-3-methyladenine glycosylase [Photorhabdus kayaii]NDL11110.1 3-methyladenine DNA glycosylase 2 [Photorhabdus kayaii]NDL24419.1 3-methyladenine DNA glycosylase 2 [Photorhabdus kayaii]RAX11442.1 3-methyladenine DNA glycosylase 2 [Photorhabdus sp. HUG-39]